MHRAEGKIRAAVEKYDMIHEGDRIAVGVSGGKDSMFLLSALHTLARYYPARFELHAVTIDPCFGGAETDFSSVTSYIESLGIEHTVRRTNLAEIIFEDRKEQNPCSLCARMRRGMLHDMCVDLGLNKIALGHHLDDAVQTFMMNLLYGGRAAGFSPVTYLSRKDITMIRPLIFCEERDILRSLERMGVPVVKSSCPVDGVTARKDTEDLISALKKDFPDIKAKIIGAMQRGKISGW